MCMVVLPGQLQVCALFACLLLRKGKEGVRSLGMGVRDGCKLSCVCLEVYLSIMENKLRPVAAEPSLQPMRLSVPKNNQHSYTYSSLYNNHIKIVSYILSIMINFLLSNIARWLQVRVWAYFKGWFIVKATKYNRKK